MDKMKFNVKNICMIVLIVSMVFVSGCGQMDKLIKKVSMNTTLAHPMTEIDYLNMILDQDNTSEYKGIENQSSWVNTSLKIRNCNWFTRTLYNNLNEVGYLTYEVYIDFDDRKDHLIVAVKKQRQPGQEIKDYWFIEPQTDEIINMTKQYRGSEISLSQVEKPRVSKVYYKWRIE